MPYLASNPPEILEVETLTQVVREIDLADEFLSQNFDFLFPVREVQGDHASFRIRKSSRSVNKLKGRNAESDARGIRGMEERKVQMPHQKEHFFLSQEDLANLEDFESEAAQMDIENLVAEEMEENRRILDRTREKLRWLAFDVQYWGTDGSNSPATGYTVTIDGVSVDVDFSYPIVNDKNNCTASEQYANHLVDYTNSTHGINEPWDTTTTDILGHLRKIRKQVVQDSGNSPNYIFCTSKTLGYILNNEEIQDLISGTGMAEGIVTGEDGDEIGQGMMRYGPIGGFFFITWDGIYEDIDGTQTQYIPDNVIYVTPSTTNWSQFQVGEVAVRDEGGEPTTVQAPATYSKATDDPVGRKVYSLDVSLPVVTRRNAIFAAKVAT